MIVCAPVTLPLLSLFCWACLRAHEIASVYHSMCFLVVGRCYLCLKTIITYDSLVHQSMSHVTVVCIAF
jgi:hypothetical protein